jgi:hypothetical protein
MRFWGIVWSIASDQDLAWERGAEFPFSLLVQHHELEDLQGYIAEFFKAVGLYSGSKYYKKTWITPIDENSASMKEMFTEAPERCNQLEMQLWCHCQ